MSSKGKVPAGNFAAAATSPQHVAKIVAPPQKPASNSVGASTAGTARAAQRSSGKAIAQHAQAPAQQASSKPATAHTAVKRPAAAQAAQAIAHQAAAGKAASLTAAQKPAQLLCIISSIRCLMKMRCCWTLVRSEPFSIATSIRSFGPALISPRMSQVIQYCSSQNSRRLRSGYFESVSDGLISLPLQPLQVPQDTSAHLVWSSPYFGKTSH